MAKFILTLIRTPTGSKIRDFTQKQLFDTLAIKVFKGSDCPPNKWTKEQSDDPHKILEIEDTLEECNKAMQQWTDMRFKKWNDMKEALMRSKMYRMLPFKKRLTISKENIKDSDYWDKFQMFLIANGIFMDVEVKE